MTICTICVQVKDIMKKLPRGIRPNKAGKADVTASPVLSRACGWLLQLHPWRLESAAPSTFETLGWRAFAEMKKKGSYALFGHPGTIFRSYGAGRRPRRNKKKQRFFQNKIGFYPAHTFLPISGQGRKSAGSLEERLWLIPPHFFKIFRDFRVNKKIGVVSSFLTDMRWKNAKPFCAKTHKAQEYIKAPLLLRPKGWERSLVRIQFRQDNRRDKIATLVKNQKHPLSLVPSRQGRGRLCFYEKNKIIALLFLIGHGYQHDGAPGFGPGT